MGYGIFGQKITGIRDIKTPPWWGLYFLFDVICLSLDMICILYQSISKEQMESPLTIADNLEPWPSYKYAAPKKDEKANP